MKRNAEGFEAMKEKALEAGYLHAEQVAGMECVAFTEGGKDMLEFLQCMALAMELAGRPLEAIQGEYN